MPIDIEALRKDPDYQALPAARQRRMVQQAMQRNTAELRESPAGQLPGVGEALSLPRPIPADIPAPELAPPGMATALGLLTPPFVSDVPQGVLPMVGELGGNLAASVTGPAAPVARPLLGAAGSAAGSALERYINTGEGPSLQQTLMDYGLSLAPQATESLIRGTARTIARSTKGAQLIRFEEAARQARQLPETTFQPLPLDDIGGMFTQVRQSGVRVGVDEMTSYLQHLTPGKQAALLEEVAQIDRLNKTGGRFTTLVEGMLGTKQGRVIGVDIGQGQQLSSELRKRLDQLEPFEARQLLKDFRGALDEDLFSGVARGRVAAGDTPEMLQQARQHYARYKAAQELSDLVERKITSTPDLQTATFNLRGFADELRRGTSEISRDITRALDLTPGARTRFAQSLENMSKLYDSIELSLADVSGFRRNWVVAGLGQMLSLAMLTESGKRLMRQAVLEGRGTLSVNGLALAANAARHELGLEAQSLGQPLAIAPPSLPAMR